MTSGSGVKSTPQNEQLAEELNKQIIRRFKKRRIYSPFRDDIWGPDLADMQSISKLNKRFRFLLLLTFSANMVGLLLWKKKKGVTIANAFQSILKDSNRKPNKICVDKGHQFYNSSFKQWLQDTDIKTYSTYNEGKSVIAERLIRTLKNTNLQIHDFSIKKWVY